MNTVLPEQKLTAMLDAAVREVTVKTAGIKLRRDEKPPGSGLCTVYIEFRKGFESSLSMCADAAMLVRMARNAMKEDSITPQDLEDFIKEYFNVLCGRISAELYRSTKISSRFSVPEFYAGRFEPEGRIKQLVLNYSDGQRERAQLIHHVPRRGSI